VQLDEQQIGTIMKSSSELSDLIIIHMTQTIPDIHLIGELIEDYNKKMEILERQTGQLFQRLKLINE
jgi:hypothetical protein